MNDGPDPPRAGPGPAGCGHHHELVMALAAAAGSAITNAALFEESRRRQRWQAAAADLSTAALTDEAGQAPRHVGRYAAEAARAAGVWVSLPDDASRAHLRVAAAAGVLADRLDAVYPVEGTVDGDAMRRRAALVVADPAADRRTRGWAAEGVGPTMAVPMLTDVAADGVLLLCRRPGEACFDAVDRDLLTGYARHAALVLELAQARDENEQLRLADDRRRIAENLRDRVIQRTSRLGLRLQALAGRAVDDWTREQLGAAIDETDTIIRELRQAIFALAADAHR